MSRTVPADRLLDFYEAVRGEEQTLLKQGWQPTPLTTTVLVSHASSAIDNFERAMDLDPNKGLLGSKVDNGEMGPVE